MWRMSIGVSGCRGQRVLRETAGRRPRGHNVVEIIVLDRILRGIRPSRDGADEIVRCVLTSELMQESDCFILGKLTKGVDYGVE